MLSCFNFFSYSMKKDFQKFIFQQDGLPHGLAPSGLAPLSRLATGGAPDRLPVTLAWNHASHWDK